MDKFMKAFLIAVFAVLGGGYSRDLTIVLPDSWEDFSIDTTKITIALPIVGCYEMEPYGKLPNKNWKGLFVQDLKDKKIDSTNSNRNTVLNDIKLKVIHQFSFSDLSRYEITYDGNNFNAINDTSQERPIAFIANLPKSQNVFTIYDGRKFNDKQIVKSYNSTRYKIVIEKQDSCIETCKFIVNNIEQLLFKNNSCLVKTKIIWMGDLNGDSKIDIILDRLGKEGLYHRLDLWLSSKDIKTNANLVSSIFYGGCH